MAGSKDNITDLLEVIESQGTSYFLVIIDEDETKKEDDNLNIYTSLSEEGAEKLIKYLKESKKEQEKGVENGKE